MKDCTQEEMTGWRNRLKKKFQDIVFWDPVAFEVKGWTDEQVVKNDLRYILKSNVVIANVWKFSVGTIMEICYAKMFGVPVFVLAPEGSKGHWLRHHATLILQTEEELDDAIEHLKEF